MNKTWCFKFVTGKNKNGSANCVWTCNANIPREQTMFVMNIIKHNFCMQELKEFVCDFKQ